MISLDDADRLAARLVEALGPACHRIEVAGSVRRRRLAVKDVELVAVPRVVERTAEGQAELFGARKEAISAVWLQLEALREAGVVRPVKPGVIPFETDDRWPVKRFAGPQTARIFDPARWLKFLYGPVAVDLFLCTVDTFGWQLALRTGPAKVSHAYVAHWAPRAGVRSVDGQLMRAGRPVATPEERDAFQALGIEWIPPELRVAPAALSPARRRA